MELLIGTGIYCAGSGLVLTLNPTANTHHGWRLPLGAASSISNRLALHWSACYLIFILKKMQNHLPAILH